MKQLPLDQFGRPEDVLAAAKESSHGLRLVFETEDRARAFRMRIYRAIQRSAELAFPEPGEWVDVVVQTAGADGRVLVVAKAKPESFGLTRVEEL